MKKWTVLLLTALLVLSCLTGCGSSGAYTAAQEYVSYDSAKPAEAYPMEAPMAAEMMVSEEAESFSTTSYSGNGAMPSESTAPSIAEKIIYYGNVSIETTEFENSLELLNKAINDFGGYVQDSSVNGRTRTYENGTTAVVDRTAYYTVRIPSEKYKGFMAMTGSMGNVISSGENAENVTSQYTDYEARLDTLKVQEERLLTMLEKSGDLDSLIQLESRLSDVRYEIERIERNLRNLDQRIAYSTVSIYMQEVSVYTPKVTVTRTFGEKLSDAFSDGWNSFVYGMQDFTIWLVESLPTLILLAIIVVVVILIIRAIRRRSKAKKQETFVMPAAAPKNESKEEPKTEQKE